MVALHDVSHSYSGAAFVHAARISSTVSAPGNLAQSLRGGRERINGQQDQGSILIPSRYAQSFALRNTMFQHGLNPAEGR